MMVPVNSTELLDAIDPTADSEFLGVDIYIRVLNCLGIHL